MELAAQTGRKIVPLVVDTLDAESIKALVDQEAETLGGIEILANCAARVGGTIPDSIDTISDEQIVSDFEEKFLGYFRCAREATPYMKQAGGGASSTSAVAPAERPAPASAHRRAISRASRLTNPCATRWPLRHSNVNAIYPGATITETAGAKPRAGAESRQDPRRISEDLRQRSLIRHLVTAEDVA